MATASAEAAPDVPALAAVDSPRAVALSAPVRRAPLGQGSSRALLRPCPRVRCGALRLVSSLARAGSRCAAGRPRLLALGHALASSESARCPQSPPSLRSGPPLSLPSRGVRGAKGDALCAFENEATPREEKRGRSRCCGSGTTAPFYFAAGESFGALAPLLRAVPDALRSSAPACRRLLIRHRKQEYYFAENKTKSTQQVASTQPPHHLAEAKQNQFYFV